MSAALREMKENVRIWRDKLINPWRYRRILYSDGELEHMVDKAFRCGCLGALATLGGPRPFRR